MALNNLLERTSSHITQKYQQSQKRIRAWLVALLLAWAADQAQAQWVGIDEPNPQNTLDVNGNAVIWGFLSGAYTAPTDWLLIFGNTWIWTLSPNAKLHISTPNSQNALKVQIPMWPAPQPSALLVDQNGRTSLGINDGLYPTAIQQRLNIAGSLRFSWTFGASPNANRYIDLIYDPDNTKLDFIFKEISPGTPRTIFSIDGDNGTWPRIAMWDWAFVDGPTSHVHIKQTRFDFSALSINGDIGIPSNSGELPTATIQWNTADGTDAVALKTQDGDVEVNDGDIREDGFLVWRWIWNFNTPPTYPSLRAWDQYRNTATSNLCVYDWTARQCCD